MYQADHNGDKASACEISSVRTPLTSTMVRVRSPHLVDRRVPRSPPEHNAQAPQGATVIVARKTSFPQGQWRSVIWGQEHSTTAPQEHDNRAATAGCGCWMRFSTLSRVSSVVYP